MFSNQTTLNPGPFRYTSSNDGIIRNFSVEPTVAFDDTLYDIPFTGNESEKKLDPKSEDNTRDE